MRTSTLARFAAIVLAIVGVAFIVAAFLVATNSFSVHVRGRTFKCGSVLAAKDPRNLVSRRAGVPQIYRQANNRCQKKSSDRTHKAITYLIAGTIPLLIVLMIPALSRRSRRARAHRRTRL
jgi:hypothetical protein